MLVVFIKSILTLSLVLVVIRLMGKRQIGEMQPFELVITLIIAEVACIPMNDPYIPFFYGIVPIITLGTVHLLISLLSRKSVRARRIISGRSIIAIDKNGINYENLKKMNINVNDLVEAVRSGGYPDFAEIEYAIFETNGKVCIIQKPSDPMEKKPALLPVSLFIDGFWEEENLTLAGANKADIENAVKQKGIKSMKDVLFIDIRQNGTMYVSPKNAPSYTETLSITGGGNW